MFTFFRLPKCLVNNVYFAELSADAKLLYAFFLDRVSLSIKNGWIDDKGRVFIYYSVKRVCKDLNCGTQKACKLLDELEKAGALERKRQGPGKPNKLNDAAEYRSSESNIKLQWIMMIVTILSLFVALYSIKNGDVINEIKNLIEWIKTLIS